MDRIYIKNLEIFANHGVFPEENRLGQKFVVSAILFTHTREAGKTDDLAKSIHYGEVSRQIKEYMENHTCKLLETVAEGLAEELLLTRPLLEQVQLEIKKPWAPVGLPLETVSVEITRGWHIAYIALGSNMGDKQAYLNMGVNGLARTKGCAVEAVSDFIVTAPYGGVEQDDFLNGAMRIRTLLTPLNCWTVSMRLRRRRTGSVLSAGAPEPWTWIFFSMTMKSWILPSCISPTLRCTNGILC